MKKYVCSICGYIYDEQKEGVRFSDLPSGWVCPLCGAPKSAFKEMANSLKENTNQSDITTPPTNQSDITTPPTNQSDITTPPTHQDKQKALTNAELNIVCANLAKGCEKQYMAEEAALFGEIAEYFRQHSQAATKNSYQDLLEALNLDLKQNYAEAFSVAKVDEDRGALRVLTWSEKVSKIVESLLSRYKAEGAKFLQNTKIFVCEICGFIYIGDEAPEICPICKVPRFKIHEVGRV